MGKPHSLDNIRDENFQENILSCLGVRTYNLSDQNDKVDTRSCGIGRSGLVIQTDGKLVTCPALMDFVVGDVNHQDLKDIWCFSQALQNIRQKKLSEFTVCGQCPARYSCGGGCRAKAYHYYGDLWYNDPISCIQYGVSFNELGTVAV